MNKYVSKDIDKREKTIYRVKCAVFTRSPKKLKFVSLKLLITEARSCFLSESRKSLSKQKLYLICKYIRICCRIILHLFHITLPVWPTQKRNAFVPQSTATQKRQFIEITSMACILGLPNLSVFSHSAYNIFWAEFDAKIIVYLCKSSSFVRHFLLSD